MRERAKQRFAKRNEKYKKESNERISFAQEAQVRVTCFWVEKKLKLK